MKRRLELFSIVVFALNAGAVGGGVTSSLADEARVEVGIGELRGAVLSLFAPPGAIAKEVNPNYKGVAAPAPAAPRSPAAADWPSYNKTLTSGSFSDLSQINTKNVTKLKVSCRTQESEDRYPRSRLRLKQSTEAPAAARANGEADHGA